MRGGQMVAFQVIIDVDLPVAIDYVIAALRKNHLVDRTSDLCDFAGNIAQYFGERRGRRILVDEDVGPPDFDAKFGEANSGLIEIRDAFELGTSDQFSIERI